jgi:hypothetical protein
MKIFGKSNNIGPIPTAGLKAAPEMGPAAKAAAINVNPIAIP